MINRIDFNYKGNNTIAVLIGRVFSDCKDTMKINDTDSICLLYDSNVDIEADMVKALDDIYGKVHVISNVSEAPDDAYIFAYGDEIIYKSVAESSYRYTYIPCTYEAAVYDSVYGDVPCLAKNHGYKLPENIIVTTKIMVDLNADEYRHVIADMLRLGMIRDAAFYEWMILNFSDICDRNPDYVVDLLFKAFSVMQFFVAKDSNKKNEYYFLNFGSEIAKALKENINRIDEPDSMALGMIASAHIAYKRQLISMEEFYEIRDMFVPFDMTISLSPFDVEQVFDTCLFKKNNEDYEMILLKKIGKAVKLSDVKRDEIIEAIKQLIVEWD